MLSDRILSTVRTTVAAGVAAALVWLAREHGIVLDEHTSDLVYWAAGLAAVAAYHAAASWVQRRWVRYATTHPGASRVLGAVVAALLGSARQPVYHPPPLL